MSKNTGTSELINYFDLGANGDVGIAGSLDVNTIANATTDTDKFLVSDTGIIKYRTGAELLTDIGAAPSVAGGYVPYTGANSNVDLGIYNLTANAVNVNGSGSNAGVINLESNAFFSLVNGYGTIGSGTTNQFNFYQTTGAGVFRGAILSLNSITASATRTFTLPDADGTIALTSAIPANPVGGTGTTNYLPKFTGASTIGNSLIFDNGTNIGIATASPISAGTYYTTLELKGKTGGGGNEGGYYFTTDADGSTIGQLGVDGNFVYLGSRSNTDAVITSNNSERIRVFAGGNVHIGTVGATDAGFKLDVNGTGRFTANLRTDVALQWNGGVGALSNGSGFVTVETNSATQIRLITNSNPALTVDTNQRIGIGTLSPQALLTISGTNQALGGAFNTYGNSLITSNESPAINIGGSISLGGRYFTGNTIIASFARIHGKKEFASDGSTAGYLSFETTVDATAALSEKMRITSDGAIGFNGSSSIGNAGLDKMSMGFLNSNYGWIQTWSGRPIVLQGVGNNVVIGNTSDNGARLQVNNGSQVGSRFFVTGTYAPIIFSGDGGTTLGGVNAYAGSVYLGRGTSTGTQGDLQISSSGLVYFNNGFGATNHRINLAVNQGDRILVISAYATSPPGSTNDTAIFYSSNGLNPNAAATSLGVTTNSSTGRSINAGGTINASGADYAEYMTKAVEDNIAKGDIVGIDNNGTVTNIFANSISFAVKSTDPSYVGGDVWGNAVGKRPSRTTDQTEEEFAPILAEFEVKLEIERVKVDRISFSGQVPCNVTGANVGDYIIPIELENGKIGGQAVSTPTFQQYQISVGKVWKIMEDGRAWIAVKIG